MYYNCIVTNCITSPKLVLRSGKILFNCLVLWYQYYLLSETMFFSLQVIEFDVGSGGQLKGNYSWLEPLVGRYEPGAAVSTCVFLFSCFAAALCLHLHWNSHDGSWWAVLLTAFFFAVLFACRYHLFF